MAELVQTTPLASVSNDSSEQTTPLASVSNDSRAHLVSPELKAAVRTQIMNPPVGPNSCKHYSWHDSTQALYQFLFGEHSRELSNRIHELDDYESDDEPYVEWEASDIPPPGYVGPKLNPEKVRLCHLSDERYYIMRVTIEEIVGPGVFRYPATRPTNRQ